MREFVLTPVSVAYHRNGISGIGFDVVLFKSSECEDFTFLGILFPEPGACAVLEVNMLAKGDIEFTSNSWRGDNFEPQLRAIINREEN